VGRSRLDRRLLLREAVHGPDVEPGTYELLWVMGTVNPSPGYALLTSEVPFEVTDWIRRAASGCPESFLLDYLKEGYRARGAASESALRAERVTLRGANPGAPDLRPGTTPQQSRHV
jgi:hypothetical protein